MTPRIALASRDSRLLTSALASVVSPIGATRGGRHRYSSSALRQSPRERVAAKTTNVTGARQRTKIRDTPAPASCSLLPSGSPRCVGVIKTLGEDSTPGTVKHVPVSMVEPVAHCTHLETYYLRIGARYVRIRSSESVPLESVMYRLSWGLQPYESSVSRGLGRPALRSCFSPDRLWMRS
jgi:hypothetical protein